MGTLKGTLVEFLNKKRLNKQSVKPLCWWSWRELNPRPQALRLWYYMLSPAIEFNWLLPTEQGVQTAISVRI